MCEHWPPRVPLRWPRFVPGRRGCLFGCVGSGVGVLVCGSSVCWSLGLYAALCGCSVGQVGLHPFLVRSCGDDMTKANLLRGSSAASCLLRTRQSSLLACLSGQRGCAHCAHLCAQAAFRPACWSFVMVLPALLHEVLCFGRHDFAAWTVDFLGRSCQRERFRRFLWPAFDPSTERRCVGSGLFFRGRSWFG